MRVSTPYIHYQGVQNMLQQQSKLVEVQNQLSRGVKHLSPSDDPSATSRVMNLDEIISRMGQYEENAGYATQRLNTEETTLDSVNTVLIRVKELAIQAGNIGTYGGEEQRIIAAELRERLQEIMDYANTKDASGEYIFSGFQSGIKPFTTDGNDNYFYNGDQGQLALQISANRQVIANDSGAEVFQMIRNGNGDFAVDANTTNGGTAQISTGSVVTPSLYQADDFSIVFAETLPATVPPQYQYNVINDVTGATVLANQPYSDGGVIAFNGIEVEISGEPAPGDIFTVTASRNQDIFTTLSNLIKSMEMPISNDVRGVIGGDFVNNGFDPGDVIDFNMQFNDQLIPINFTVGALDTNADIANSIFTQIAAVAGPANPDGSVTIAGTTPGTDITFRLDATGTAVEFISSGGTNDNKNSFGISNLRDSGLNDATLSLTASGNTVASASSTSTPATATNIAAVRTDISAGLDLSAAPLLARTFSLEVDGVTQSVVIPAADYTVAGIGDGTSDALLTAIDTAINTAFGSQVATASESAVNGLALTTTSAGPGTTITVAEAAGPSTGAAALFGAVIPQITVGTGAVSFLAGVPHRSFLSQQIDNALNNLNQSMDSIIDVQTSIGGRLNSIDSQLQDNEDRKIQLQQIRSDIRDLDFAEAISNLTFQTAALQAAQQTFVKIQNLTLFNYI